MTVKTIWKTIPSWFNLDNYNDSAFYNAEQWCNELEFRMLRAGQINGSIGFSGHSPTKIQEIITAAKEEINSLKSIPLVSKRYLPRMKLEEVHIFARKAGSIVDLTESECYHWFYLADNKDEFLNDAETLIGGGYSPEEMEIRRLLLEKYDKPIAESIGEKQGVITINLYASDQQILNDFAAWLSKARKNDSETTIKNSFSKNHFDDWHKSKILPYWDLTTIASLENATIPSHVIGAALFPNEFDVDLTERVRKVTKPKCKNFYSWSLYHAIRLQADSEKPEWSFPKFKPE